jgi:putative transposase
MSRYRRANTLGGTYFFTVVTYRRRPFLCDEDVRAALRIAIERVRERHPFAIEAWVLLPDHLHTIWTLPEGDANFSFRWGAIKRHVSLICGERLNRPELMSASKKKHRESTLWQRRYWEHLIRDEEDFCRHVDYLHYNPVKHGLVDKVIGWPYSSFHRFRRMGVYADDWGVDISPKADIGE